MENKTPDWCSAAAQSIAPYGIFADNEIKTP